MGNIVKNGYSACIALMLFSMLLFGCSVIRSDFQPPELDIPSSWKYSVQPQAKDKIEQLDEWWRQFDDPQLDSLIEQVLHSNSDLAQATLTLEKARLEAGLSANNKFPTLSFSHDSSLELEVEEGSKTTSLSSNLSLSYELDLWERVNAMADADEWSAKASYQDRETTVHSLVATTASLYWKLGYLSERVGLSEQNIADTARIAELAEAKFNRGAATRLELLEPAQTLLAQRGELSQLKQELFELENAISVLLNQPLKKMDMRVKSLSEQRVPDVDAGVPSSLLIRRPDVKAALYRLQSSLATRDAVSASYMPSITLTGSLNTSSSDLLELLNNPVAKLGSEILLPFLEWNKMELEKGISMLDYQMAVNEYRATVYVALEEVSNLLFAKQHARNQGQIYAIQDANASQIEAIYASRYRYGANDMTDWLNAMESKRNIQSSLLENKYNQLVIQAKLYQSLGGGVAPKLNL